MAESETFRPFIDGEFRDTGGPVVASINPANGQPFAEVRQCNEQDVDEAVRAAQRAFGEWSQRPAPERGAILVQAAEILRRRLDEFAELETRDVGKPITDTRTLDVPAAADFLEWYGKVCLDIRSEVIPLPNPRQIDFTLRQPYGVVGLIAPWNFPLVIAVLKIGPAVAVGNTTVMLPAQHTSLTTLRLADVFREAGMPPGVVNVVTGPGPVVGEAICRHPLVRKVFFTGSTRTGRRIMELARENLADVALELGGKSPNIIFADARRQQALSGALFGILMNNGQNCIAGSRLLVQREIYDDYVAELAERFGAVAVGDPMDPRTRLGPLVSSEHHERVCDYIRIGREEGARVVCGGGVPEPAPVPGGYWVEPTLFGDVHNQMRIAREEIFGPVLVALAFEDEDEAVAIANDTPYGLGAGVFTTDLDRAQRMVRRLECGTVYVNTYNMVYPQAPFPAWKQSGNAIERGLEGLRENTRLKNVVIDISGEPIAWP